MDVADRHTPDRAAFRSQEGIRRTREVDPNAFLARFDINGHE